MTRIKFLFAWYDLWVGAYWDRKGKKLYILPIPMCGIVIDFSPSKPHLSPTQLQLDRQGLIKAIEMDIEEDRRQ